jgi:hypothetical protein
VEGQSEGATAEVGVGGGSGSEEKEAGISEEEEVEEQSMLRSRKTRRRTPAQLKKRRMTKEIETISGFLPLCFPKIIVFCVICTTNICARI